MCVVCTLNKFKAVGMHDQSSCNSFFNNLFIALKTPIMKNSTFSLLLIREVGIV